MTHRKTYFLFCGFISLALFASACGGGGGGDSSGPGPSPTTVTYTVQLTDASLIDGRTGAAVTPTGLPVTGAQATRQQ